ncbi:hypothetical protein QQS21_010553 [Conoideocrella luteorostrata]|uniref:Thioesterase family protein n=1 Tax=Conoideocrella luteorostrata TaxID=1105319 RepID=A0AAJ0FUK6_9HYPO|nr:hypothetical protein QQS21_010553 [Conoideocrella luteorostrata]
MSSNKAAWGPDQAEDEDDFTPPSLEQLTQVSRLSDNIFSIDLSTELCVGTVFVISVFPANIHQTNIVPNGGYVASILLRAAQEYLTPHDQRNTLKIHIQYLNRTTSGPAYILVEEAKIGRNTSVLHISLLQQAMLESAPWLPPNPKAEVVAYVTNTNLDNEQGLTLNTGWTLQQEPLPADLSKIREDEDPNWKRLYIPMMKRVSSFNTLEYYFQRKGHTSPSMQDYWLRCANGENFTDTALGYVADAAAALIPEAFRQRDGDRPLKPGEIAIDQAFWYPTVTMGIDVKRKLAEGGEEWLRMRAASKAMNNGRSDMEIVIFNAKGELVALSHHVALAVDFSRNLKEKKRPESKM